MAANDSSDTLANARAAKAQFSYQFSRHTGVQGVGVGYRRKGGEKTGEYAVVIHVHKKLPLDDIPHAERLPTELRFEGEQGGEIVVRVDVQEHLKPTPEGDRVRPVPGGVSAGVSGTLGGWVWDTVTRQIVALSNAHVFGTEEGDIVTQPSIEEGGREGQDSIALVLRTGSLDAAIAAPVGPGIASRSITGGIPAVFSVAEPVVGMRVQKTGHGTGLTFGVVDLIDYDSDYFGSHSDVWIDGGGVDFSSGGDSGALYLEADHEGTSRRVIGLHWGGSGNDGVGHHILAVFADLRLAAIPAEQA
jgi:hypothetical protein